MAIGLKAQDRSAGIDVPISQVEIAHIGNIRQGVDPGAPRSALLLCRYKGYQGTVPLGTEDSFRCLGNCPTCLLRPVQ